MIPMYCSDTNWAKNSSHRYSFQLSQALFRHNLSKVFTTFFLGESLHNKVNCAICIIFNNILLVAKIQHNLNPHPMSKILQGRRKHFCQSVGGN